MAGWGTRVLLSWIREPLRSCRRVQQSGFTLHRSTIDRIITLQLLLQTRNNYYCHPLRIAYVDQKVAFDSVNREAVLLSLGLLPKLDDLLYRHIQLYLCR